MGAGANGRTERPAATPEPPSARGSSPFRFGFNTSTVMGQKLPIDQIVKLTAEAGYDDIEPWIRELDAYQQSGGKLADLARLIADSGLKVPSAIGFFDWIVDDETQRRKAFDEAKRSMELVQRIGGTRIAAPPAGATDNPNIDPRRAAERYAKLVEIGRSMGVIPQLEIWGFSKTLGKLSDAAFVAIESGQPDACVLADVYHLRKGGTVFESLKYMTAAGFQHFHMNDYPGSISREVLKDSDRIYPGDGEAPLEQILGTLISVGFRGTLSLELFNPDYWKQDAALVIKTGLEKMRAVASRVQPPGAVPA
jgi:sugar phosphate isomerase/epimerase